MRALFLTIIFAFSLTACNIERSIQPNSGGRTLEVLVVCSRADFEGALGDTLRVALMRPNPSLNQAEPMFTLANVAPNTFERTDMFQRMRSIIIINFTQENLQRFSVRRDVWANNQIIFQFNVPNPETFFTLFRENQELMEQAFFNREHARMISTFRTTESVAITDRLRSTFGFRLIAPDQFRIRTSNPNFVSINRETRHFGQNIMVHSYPFTANSFTQEDIIRVRNEISQRYIFGPIEGSFMTTEYRIPPISREVNLNGRYAIETRGLWRLIGDFMGGPFVNYVFFDEERNQMIMIDGFVYAPGRGKRDLLLQLEAIAYSIDRVGN
ncbi:MAG: DUF4837 family protein [Bacteroidales bacterium]|nr:DUF4837 family protein [Bacteroidales bacterium]